MIVLRMAMSVGKGTADGGALAAKFDHAPLTARAARVAPPRTTVNSSEKGKMETIGEIKKG